MSAKPLFATIVAVVAVITIGLTIRSGPLSRSVRPLDGQDVPVNAVGVLREAELCEVSGIVRGRANAGSWWMHNDSGDSPRLFLVSNQAKLMQSWELGGAMARDWEDIAGFSAAKDKHYLLIGDVGDNSASRTQCELYLLAEPESPPADRRETRQSRVQEVLKKIEFVYEDGARNCEAMAVDVQTRSVWLVEKLSPELAGRVRAGVYRLDLSPYVPEWQADGVQLPATAATPPGNIATARRVAELPLTHVTAMDINDDGNRMIVRDYYQARLWERSEDETWEECLRDKMPPPIQLPLEPQGEAIAFAADSSSVVTISEFTYQPLWQVTLPERKSPEPVATQEVDKPVRSSVQDKKLILPGEVFEVDNKVAFIFWPAEDKRQQPQPWVFYAPTLSGYPDNHELWMHQQFLDAGVAVAGIDVGEAYGSPESRKVFDTFYDHLVSQRGFAKKPVLLGRSRGGLWVTSWAADHPERFAGLAGIYPVFDWTTYPGVEKAAVAYGVSSETLVEKAAEWNPISRVTKLADAGVPVFMIHGDQDQVVPLGPNSQAFANVYEMAGKSDRLILEVVPGQGHNYWEGFFRSQRLVDFVIQKAKSLDENKDQR